MSGVLTGEKLEEIGLALYGEGWPGVLAGKLRRSKRTIFRWRDDETGRPNDLRHILAELVDDQIAFLASYAIDLRQGPGEQP